MKIKVFNYRKLRENVNKDYEVLVIKDMDTSIEGLSIHDLSEPEKKELLSIYEEFEKKLEKFMPYYRKFNKAQITKTYN